MASTLTAVGHGQREGPIVSEVSVELVLELSAPDGLAAGAVAQRIALVRTREHGKGAINFHRFMRHQQAANIAAAAAAAARKAAAG